jgi:hypothetical protein
MDGQRVGYVRVSSFDQNLDWQLEAVSVARTFIDKASGNPAPRIGSAAGLCARHELAFASPLAARRAIADEVRVPLGYLASIPLLTRPGVHQRRHLGGLLRFNVMTGALRCQRLRSSRQWASRRVSCRRVSRRRSVDQHLMLPSYQPRNPARRVWIAV